MVISAKEQRCYNNLFAKNAFDVGCTQARETTLCEYTLMMVVATWAPPDGLINRAPITEATMECL